MTLSKKCVLVCPDGVEAICWATGKFEKIKFPEMTITVIEIRDGEVSAVDRAAGYSTRPLMA